MSDSTKEQKLAAARKKLKEFQKKAKQTKKEDTSAASSISDHVEKQDDLTSSTHSSLNGQTVPDTNSNLPIHNYFSNVGYDSAYNNRSNFFDNFSKSDSAQVNESNSNLFNTAVYLDNKLYSMQVGFDTDSVAMEDPEIKPINELYENRHKSLMTQDDADEIKDYIDRRDQEKQNEFFEKADDKQDSDLLDAISNMKQEELAKDNPSELVKLSNQLAQIIEPKLEEPEPDADLNERNRQLQDLLDQERIRSEQLNTQLEISQDRTALLEQELENVKLECATYKAVKDELQYHVQTVNILVGEKAELTNQLSEAQEGLKQKIGECEELSARLRTSRSRVADLEKEVANLKSEKRAGDDFKQVFLDLEAENGRLKERSEEMALDLSELRAKLAKCEGENRQLQNQLNEANLQLSLAGIKIQQLSSGEARSDDHLERFAEEKAVYEKQVTELTSQLNSAINDKNQVNTQYQQYVQQLNGQLTNLAARLETVTKENETLTSREQALISHIGELEKHLQRERIQPQIDTSELENALQTLRAEKTNLEESFTRVSNERDMLLKDLEAKKESIVELEDTVERLQAGQPDSVKLLATIESDKVAASRAVAQNSELKKQLQEMQDDFVKVTNDKLELIELLTSEQNQNKDLKHRLQQIEVKLQTLTDAIEIKDKELTEMRETFDGLNKQMLQQGQLADRLRHYEAQDHSSHALQSELHEAKQFIAFLTNENVKLKEMLEKRGEDSGERSGGGEGQNSSGDSAVVENVEDSTPTIDKDSAMKYLEQKFLKTMQDIASLTDEKQRLEHIVLQLQGETETIGEYIALYQHQRGILKQRALEKDEQLKQLARDREQMKNQLDQLNQLVKRLIVEKGALPADVLEQHESLCKEHAKIREESENGVANEGTAEKIMELLSEIKTSNLVQPSENFHPCPLCSGKLITV